MAKLKVFFTIDDRPELGLLEAVGRDAWVLLSLHGAGVSGCTPIDHPGPRWSHYVWKLRQAGVDIETIDEPPDGPFAGMHARYVLKSPLTFVSNLGAEEAA
jgi:ribosomal protein S12 methylthiotransferase accessory factor YcaO